MEAGNLVRVCISDSGPGIPVQERDHVFEAYYQMPGAPPDRRTSYTGTGLGLATTRALLTRLGGRIWVEDAPSGGARFTFVLPKARP